MLKLMENKIPKYYAEIVCLSKPREDPNQAITSIYSYELNVLIEFFYVNVIEISSFTCVRYPTQFFQLSIRIPMEFPVTLSLFI